jgi:hypothetical protein
MKHGIKIVLYCLFIFLFSACYTLKVKNIKYNTEKELYEYWPNKRHSHILRDAKGSLVTEENIDGFRQELDENKNTYPFSKRHERSAYISRNDQVLTSKYSLISERIVDHEYVSALDEISNLKRIYPDIFKYSDALFLEGYSYEQLHLLDSARVRYSEFLRYSESKYSARFRGYRDADSNDSLYLLQRNYVNKFLNGESPEISQDVFQEITPRYYYRSFSPGFNVNSEDIVRGGKGFIWLGLTPPITNNFAYSIQTYHKLNDHFDINPEIFFTNSAWGLNLALPVQLYKASDNRFGLKFSSFVNYTRIDSLLLDDTKYNVKQGVFSGGVKLSVGFYLTQEISVGAYYTYHINNADNPVFLTKPNINIWRDNVYDVSLYYNIFKTFGLKSGIRNGGLVAGLYWNGWELSYDITHSEFIFRMEMY